MIKIGLSCLAAMANAEAAEATALQDAGAFPGDPCAGIASRASLPTRHARKRRGDAEQGRLRLAALAEFPSLPITPEVENLAAEFLRTGALPPAARSDAIHLAVTTIVRGDYLLTWNCRHLANA